MGKEIIILCSMVLAACTENNDLNAKAMDEADKFWKEQTEAMMQTRGVGSLMDDKALQTLTRVNELSRE